MTSDYHWLAAASIYERLVIAKFCPQFFINATLFINRESVCSMCRVHAQMLHMYCNLWLYCRMWHSYWFWYDLIKIYVWIYFYPKNWYEQKSEFIVNENFTLQNLDTNKYPNIFIYKSLTQTNIWKYSCPKNLYEQISKYIRTYRMIWAKVWISTKAYNNESGDPENWEIWAKLRMFLRKIRKAEGDT